MQRANRGGARPCGKGEGGADDRTYHPHRPEGSAFCDRCGAYRGHLGLEPVFDCGDPEHQGCACYMGHMLLIAEQLHRVLRRDGSLWLNMGDSYACSPNGRSAADTKAAGNDDRTYRDKPISTAKGPGLEGSAQPGGVKGMNGRGGLREKNLLLQPHRLAIALQSRGWIVRNDAAWCKENPMPCSATDRMGVSKEYVFLLTKTARYFYDYFAVRVPASPDSVARAQRNWNGQRERDFPGNAQTLNIARMTDSSGWRNLRDVWKFPTNPAGGRSGHFAAFPSRLASTCIRAGSSEAGVCAGKIKKLRLRSDLTQEERTKVIAVLKERGVL